MLHLKEANYEDIEKEYLFVRDMPVDENGLTNPYHGISREEFESKALPEMIAFQKGENLPEGYVPETFLFLWEDADRFYVRIRNKETGYMVRPGQPAEGGKSDRGVLICGIEAYRGK